MTFDWKKHFTKRPCNAALEWIEENGIETMSEAWEKCHRGDWLVWALEHRSDGYALTEKQRVKIAVKLIRETPVGDGRTVYDLLTDERSIKAIEVAEHYVAGEASDDELREAISGGKEAEYATRAAAEWAADAAGEWAASAAGARAASEAAEWAARAAAEWAASEAASEAKWEARAVATKVSRKAQADIIRQWWPVWVPEGEI